MTQLGQTSLRGQQSHGLSARAGI